MSTTDYYTKVTIATRNNAEKDLLIGLLGEAGYEAFEEEQRVLHAFIRADTFDAEALLKLLEPLSVAFSSQTIAPTNWNAEWEKNFEPVVVPGFCAVRAAFHEPLAGVRYDLVITPKMSFGTGHHATTYLMLQEMAKIDFMHKNVLDFGTGTGVLAILAEKLGAAIVLAIDNDAWSIENAAENVAINACKRIRVERADELGAPGPFDVILANINRNVLTAQMDRISQHLAEDGVVLMSGLLCGDSEIITSAAAANNLLVTDEQVLEGWIALRLIHK